MNDIQFWARISTNENSEFFPVGASAAEDPALFEPEKRFQVTMEILRNLPNLVSIDIDITILLQGRTEELLNNIKSRGSTLQGLHLTADAMSLRFTSTQLCPVLEALPNIKHLEITGIDRDSEDAPSLRDTIAKMSQLTCLDLADAHCVQDDWAQADWQCQLRAIDLDE